MKNKNNISRGDIVIDDRIVNKDYTILWLNTCKTQKPCRGFYTSNSEYNEIILCNSGKHKFPQLEKK